MEFNERMREQIKKSGITQADLARALGVSVQTVNYWLIGRNKPKRDKILRIAHLLQCSPQSLEFGDDIEEIPGKIGEIEETASTWKEFPLISWVQAGSWSEMVDNFQPGDAERWIPFGITRKDIPNGYCLRVRGDSMEPEFADGDIILVDPHRQPENGQYVIVKLLDSNEATFKKYVIDAGEVSLHPLNYPKYQPIHLNGRKAMIVGVVIAKQKMY